MERAGSVKRAGSPDRAVLQPAFTWEFCSRASSLSRLRRLITHAQCVQFHPGWPGWLTYMCSHGKFPSRLAEISAVSGEISVKRAGPLLMWTQVAFLVLIIMQLRSHLGGPARFTEPARFMWTFSSSFFDTIVMFLAFNAKINEIKSFCNQLTTIKESERDH